MIIDGNLADLLSQRVDVVLQSDVLQQRVLEDGLQLLVDLQTQLQRHPRVCHLAIVQTCHDSLAGSNFCLKYCQHDSEHMFVTTKEY